MKAEYIYALQNKSFGVHHIKIGKTTREPDLRAREIYSTGVPEPFDIAFACQVADCGVAEKKIHEILKAYRSNRNREFFIISIEVVKRLIFSVCQQVNESLGYFIENLIVIDSQNVNKFASSLEDNDTEDSSGISWINIDNLILSPPGSSSLSDEQKQRVEVVSEILANVRPIAYEQWILDISRDMIPEIEICVWETIAKAFLKIDQVKYLSDEQKKEAFYLLLMRSMMSASKVMENVNLTTFSRKAAKEILRGYEDSPVPIGISLHYKITQGSHEAII